MSAFSAAAQDEDGDIIKTLQARVADLEAQLYAVGAGGVGSPVARQDHPEQHLDMVPEGWKLVPVEPDEKMREAGKDAHYEAETRTSDSDAWSLTGFAHRVVRASYVYRAMIAAAPQPPVVEQPQGEQQTRYLAGGTRYKVVHLKTAGYCIHGLPREMLGQWVAFVDATDNKHMDSRQPQSVAYCHQSQPQGEHEPVAYYVMNGAALFQLFRSKSQADALAYDLQKRHDLSGSLAHFHVVPLYTHPQPKRQPLTDEQIKAGLIDSIDFADQRDRCAFNIGVRFAERAHKIGGES